ncbi:hypothetical protein ACFU5O_03525 [Streptomyces sp. NPDC057445]|uniref:hypothetical protein n=1 Tax=Streptomyces sp. NPDC057445 TaxID=3346136 RepID=UPI0036B22AC0
MRKIARAAATGALVLPLVLGAAGIAAADAGPVHGQFESSANAAGASNSGVLSGFLGAGDQEAGSAAAPGSPVYLGSSQTADAAGASSSAVSSGVDADGHTYYLVNQMVADENGASSSMTFSRS